MPHVDVGTTTEQSIPVIKTPDVVVAVSKEPEPVSLISYDEDIHIRPELKEVVIPGNLPLLPFESSPHVWSFSRYKDVFHGEVMPTTEKQISLNTANSSEAIQFSQEVLHSQSKPTATPSEEDEVLFEKTPLTKGDESLVFLAGAMLLAIILILGYMSSNGRF